MSVLFYLNSRIRKVIAGIELATQLQRAQPSVELTAVYSPSKGDLYDPLVDGAPSRMLQQVVVDCVIAQNASLSGEVDLGLTRLVGIQVPAGWTAADLTFQAGHATGALANLFEADSDTEISAEAGADRFIRLNAADWIGIRFLKVRSGTSAAAVNQTGSAKTLKLICQP